jgi:cystathionine beta-lyase
MSIFDEVIHRRNTESYKWDSFNDPNSVISMPVADMDFRCAEPILSAMNEVTSHGIFGYSIIPDKLNDIFKERVYHKYRWNIKKEWLVWVPGLIPAVTSICNMVGSPGDEIITTIPAYYPIHLAPERVGKKLIPVPMILENSRWTFDFDTLEKAITPKTKLFILCNPYNPGGTVFNKFELEKLVNLCTKNNILICSDEIHCDLILENSKHHIPVAALNERASQATITLMAPSKTFNLAGLGCSVAIIPNEELRKKFQNIKEGLFPFLSRYAIHASIAAYQHGESWRMELIRYLKSNHDYVYERINSIPRLLMNKQEATYLAWIKCDIPGFSEDLLSIGVRVNDGKIYLKEGYFRLNFACPKIILEKALNRIQHAVKIAKTSKYDHVLR